MARRHALAAGHLAHAVSLETAKEDEMCRAAFCDLKLAPSLLYHVGESPSSANRRTGIPTGQPEASRAVIGSGRPPPALWVSAAVGL